MLDEDFGARVADAMRGRGIDVWTRHRGDGFEPDAVLTSAGDVRADLVILGLGVAPRSQLAARGRHRARRARAPSGSTSARRTTSTHVWAAGDCAESTHLVTGEPVHIALGTYANRHGRVAGINMAGGAARSPRVLGTAVTKLCTLEVALTGLRLERGQGGPVRCRRHHRRHHDASPATSPTPPT